MSSRIWFVVSLACALGAAACAEGPDDTDRSLPNKDELIEGKADSALGCWLLGAPSDCDVCDEMGWYGDGSCDQALVDLGVCSEPDPDCAPACFLTHVDHAIALNLERKPRYQALSGGASRSVSNALIRSERVARLAAILLDDRARSWQRQGVAVLCDELVSMDETPPFRERSEIGPVALDHYAKQDGARLALRLGSTWHADGYAGLTAAIEQELQRLAETPSFHCMLRHVLESTLRAANLAPIHERNAAALGLPSTASLSRDFVALQLASLVLMTGLDDDAAPLQAQGIPILCQDVPPIAPLP